MDKPPSIPQTQSRQKTQPSDGCHKICITRGNESLIITDSKSEVQSCIKSSDASIDEELFGLENIKKTADAFLQQRLKAISDRETSLIHQVNTIRQDLIGKLLEQGLSHKIQYECYYQKLTQEFVGKLEMEMSMHLDKLQKRMEQEKKAITNKYIDTIKILKIQAEEAKKSLVDQLQRDTAIEQKKIIDNLSTISNDIIGQALGLEESRKLNLDVYATAGAATHGEDYVRETNGERYSDIITRREAYAPEKRTLYVINRTEQIDSQTTKALKN